jgi:hypothetical protein
LESARAVGVNPIGACLLALGAVLILAAFSLFNWFRDGRGFFAGAGSRSTFADVHDKLEITKAQAAAQGLSGHVSFGASEPYFSWLGWVLFAAALAAGATAVSRFGGRHWWVRWLAAVIAASGVAFTFLALNLVVFEGNAPNNANAPSYSDFVGHSGLGAWSAIAGFVLIIVGVLYPRRDV